MSEEMQQEPGPETVKGKVIPGKATKNERKVIHMTTSTSGGGLIICTALCDDGTLWWKYIMAYSTWQQIETP